MSGVTAKLKTLPIIVCLLVCACADTTGELTARSRQLRADRSAYSTREVIPSVFVTVWPGGTLSAFTMTFDDATNDHSTHVLEVLKKYGFHGTFYLNTWLIGTDVSYYGEWTAFQEIMNAGNEIGSHTCTHPHLKTLDLGEADHPRSAAYEIAESKRDIERHFPGYRCLTFSYPFSEHNGQIEREVTKCYIAARSDLFDYTSMEMNDQTPADMVRLRSFIPFFPNRRTSVSDDDRAFDKVVRILQKMINDQRWGMVMIHRVVPFDAIHKEHAFQPMSREWFDGFCKLLREASDRGLVHVDTCANIAKYIHERDNLKSSFIKRTPNTITVNFDTSLDPKIYDCPLTVEIEMPVGWHGCEVFVNGTRTDNGRQVVRSEKRYSQFEMVPANCVVLLKKRNTTSKER
jgi:peptidoglycan/xylan/chitin deacetylase (PgdA/CDA1 family)